MSDSEYAPPSGSPEYDYLLQAVETDKWPVLLEGRWIDKKQTIDLLREMEAGSDDIEC